MKRLCDSTEDTLQEVKKARVEQSAIQEAVNRQDVRGHNAERLAILDWLTPINYASQQQDFIRRRQPGTGEWLLKSASFQDWMRAKKKTLFCPGIPGAGKTILTSIVADHLGRQFHDQDVGIAYIYCNFRRKDEQKVDSLLASILKQLSETHPAIPSTISELYAGHKSKGTRPSTDELRRALTSVAATHSRVFIVVDALDECQTSDGCRSRFVEDCFALQARCRANLFMTSRFLPEVTEMFDKASTFEIRASPEDVRNYLTGQIFRLPGFVSRDIVLQEEIKNEIINSVDGM
jgi:hypothetical protein